MFVNSYLLNMFGLKDNYLEAYLVKRKKNRLVEIFMEVLALRKFAELDIPMKPKIKPYFMEVSALLFISTIVESSVLVEVLLISCLT